MRTAAARDRLLAEHAPLIVDLHAGKAMARFWTLRVKEGF